MVYRIENDDGKFSRVVHADRLKNHFHRRAADVCNAIEVSSEEESDLEVYIEAPPAPGVAPKPAQVEVPAELHPPAPLKPQVLPEAAPPAKAAFAAATAPEGTAVGGDHAAQQKKRGP